MVVSAFLRINGLRTEISTYGVKRLYEENWFPLLDMAIMGLTFVYFPVRVTYLETLLPHQDLEVDRIGHFTLLMILN